MAKTIWHGLSFEQWNKLWDHAGWRVKIAATLVDVACSLDAAAPDRLMALQVMNEAITMGVIKEDLGYPELMRDVLLEVVSGARGSRWFARRKRKALHARLIGARWMLQTSYQFRVDPELEEQARAGAPLSLMS